MSQTRHPISQAARERLREAQRREAHALTAVEKAVVRRDHAAARLAAAQVAPQRRLDEAELALTRARADLADVSGIDRAATLLGESPAQVRAAIRHARRESAMPEKSGPGPAGDDSPQDAPGPG